MKDYVACNNICVHSLNIINGAWKIVLSFQVLEIEQLILKRFRRKTYLTFMFYYHNKFYKETWDLMIIERQQIEYWVSILNQIIRKKKLCYDIRYIIIEYIC